MSKFAMEIQDQFNYFAFKVCNQILHCVLHFNERLDETLLLKAVRLTLKTDPILSCRLVCGEQVYWETSVQKDSPLLFKVVQTQNTGRDLAVFLAETIDVESGPLVQVRLFRGKKDTICIKISHAISDAGGLKEYAIRLAGVYSDLACGKNTAAQSEPSRRDQKQFIENLPQSVIAEMQKKSSSFGQQMIPNWSFPSQNHETTRPGYVICRLGLKKIKDAARSSKATINDFLLAAFCRALLLEGGHPADRPMMVQVPVDLRRYLAANTKAGICNLSGSEHLHVQLDCKADFDAVLEKVTQYIGYIKNNYPGLMSAFALEGLSRLGFDAAMLLMQGNMERAKTHNVSIPILTNMGSIPVEGKVYGPLSAVDGYMVSPFVYAPGFMVGVSSFDDTLTLTVGYSEDATGRTVVERFLHRMAREMGEEPVLTSDDCSFTIKMNEASFNKCTEINKEPCHGLL